MQKSNQKVTNKEFVQAWLKCYNNRGNFIDIARDLDISKQLVNQKATALRIKGVKLPSLKESINSDDVASLNALISENNN